MDNIKAINQANKRRTKAFLDAEAKQQYYERTAKENSKRLEFVSFVNPGDPEYGQARAGIIPKHVMKREAIDRQHEPSRALARRRAEQIADAKRLNKKQMISHSLASGIWHNSETCDYCQRQATIAVKSTRYLPFTPSPPKPTPSPEQALADFKERFHL